MKNIVEEQYTNWVYPEPIEDMQVAISKGEYIEIGDALLYWPLMWPNKRGIDKLDILVAGCGTNQAAYHACRNPNWNVIGIDLSDSSLKHQEYLKQKHNLHNLRLEKLDLTKIKTLGLEFDLITSTGVLHHLSNPDEGLKALQSVLRPEGVMNLMVYGSSLRLGVYMMQEVFRLLRCEQNKSDVDIVRTTINSLPKNHVLKRYMNEAPDLKYDAGIVDTFLHPQDRAYSVLDLFDFTRKAGLEFISWCDPILYSLEAAIPADHPLWIKIHASHINNEEKYHIHDLLIQDRGTHRWLCGHPEYVSKIKIDFHINKFLNYSLLFHHSTEVVTPANLDLSSKAILKRGDIRFDISSELSMIVEKMDGKSSIKNVMERLNLNMELNQINLLNLEVKSLYERGHIYVLLPEEK